MGLEILAQRRRSDTLNQPTYPVDVRAVFPFLAWLVDEGLLEDGVFVAGDFVDSDGF